MKDKLTFDDGSDYEGDVVDGKPHGKGKMTYANGKIKEGNWNEGKFKGFFGSLFGR